MNHRLKIWPQFYSRVLDGSKTFEVRDNDRGFQQGDTVTLCEFDPEPINATSKNPKGFTRSPELSFKIGYVHVLNGSEVIFSLLPLTAVEVLDLKTEAPEQSPVKKSKRRKG